jgi:hypothetical protein
MAPQIRARKPTGRVPYPLILVEGAEKAGKSWAAAVLSSSPRVGQTYWLDLGEGGADEYGAIPGTRFLVLEHDGTFAQIYEQVLAVTAEAARAKAAGEPPVVLVIDSITDVWNGLKAWVDERHRRSPAGQAALRKDADAELKPTQNLWNDANSRHRRLMSKLMTFPGIVVITARGKEVTEVKDGKPVQGSKVWSVETQKDVPYDATLWLRMFRDQRPIVIGARSVHAGIRPGEEPQPIAEDHPNLLDWLIFDVLKVDPLAASPRELVHTTGGDLTDDERAAEPEARERPAQPQDRPGMDRAKAQALAKQCARKLTAASRDEDVDTIAKTIPAALAGMDVAEAVTAAQRTAAATVFPKIPASGPIELWIWGKACRACIEKNQMSVRDASAYDEPDRAPAEPALATP